MAQGINPIGPVGITPGGGADAQHRATGADFKNVLTRAISEVNDMQIDAETAINNLATGKTENVTEVMAAVEKADLAFKNLMAIRNKIIDAYKEIQQLRI